MGAQEETNFWEEFIPKSWVCFKEYSWKLFKGDLSGGITVGIVSIPLAMAFAMASGVSPERGLYTSIIAGFLISLLGGSRFQIGGPTGAFVVIIYDIIQRNGYEGLVIATFIAAVILLIAAFSRLGALIKYIPYPLITGFTTGIAVVIFSSQIKDFLGLKIEQLPAAFIPKWAAMIPALSTIHYPTLLLAGGTLIFIILIKRFLPVVPWGIAGVVGATLVSWGFSLPVETIFTRFGELERIIPIPSWPSFSFSWADLHPLLPDAVTIAFLAGVESLLSAIVADGMGGTRHKSNCELMAQGIGNMGSVIFGGIPATGALARTATNVKSGAKTPAAGMIHAFTVFAIMFLFAPIVSQIPLAALSAVMMMVAWNMSEVHHFHHLFRAPFGDVAVLLTTFLLTVLVDLTVAVEIGMILALFTFMKRMKETGGVTPMREMEREYSEEKFDMHVIERKSLPPGVEVYEITGPFFFGVADSLKDTLTNLEFPPKVFILRMRKVPVIDASGMHALREFHHKCVKTGTVLFLSGVHAHLYESLKKFGVIDLIGENHIFSSLHTALKEAAEIHAKP